MGRVGDKTIIRRRVECDPTLSSPKRTKGWGTGRLQEPAPTSAARLGRDGPNCDWRSERNVCKLRAVLRIPDEYQRVKPDENEHAPASGGSGGGTRKVRRVRVGKVDWDRDQGTEPPQRARIARRGPGGEQGNGKTGSEKTGTRDSGLGTRDCGTVGGLASRRSAPGTQIGNATGPRWGWKLLPGSCSLVPCTPSIGTRLQ
jgi:hypothetical protein